ncbi:hypothetical protein PIB30_102046, partial [Stylosanthes scabra]|nr:hypothetical protein [Stylosanthes scabra]
MTDYDDHLFFSLFNKNMFEEFARNKDIISEKGFELGEEEYPEIQHQINLRGWKRLTSPRTKVKVLMIKEFFANAARTQEELDEEEQHPLTSFVRGVEVDFSPANIKRVMKFKDNTPGAEIDYNTRLYANQMLEEVLRDLCIPGATWKLGKGQPPQPIQVRRKELQPLARGWLELIIHNIHPILKGEDVRVEELISARIANIAQNLNLKGAESWVNHEAQYEQQQQNYYEPHHSPQPQPQHQPQPQPQFVFDFQVLQEQQQQSLKALTDLVTNSQIDTLNYYEKIKTYQEYQYDQMKAIIAQQQEVIAIQNQEFQAMRSKQDQLEKELSEIRKAQVNL